MTTRAAAESWLVDDAAKRHGTFDGGSSVLIIARGMPPSMAWRFEGRLTVVVHGPQNPSNLEWQGMLRDEAARGRPENGRTLVVSYGGGPDGRQRELLAREMSSKPAPTCIMTSSALVRAIAAALLFFNRTMKVVGLDERESAYDFLNLAAQERDAADRLRRELEAHVGINRVSARPTP
jgi:hypothetical protein